jgi:hypothetical protein
LIQILPDAARKQVVFMFDRDRRRRDDMALDALVPAVQFTIAILAHVAGVFAGVDHVFDFAQVLAALFEYAGPATVGHNYPRGIHQKSSLRKAHAMVDKTVDITDVETRASSARPA